MPSLIHLVYSSVATANLGAEDLAEILGQSRANNERAGITGMLLYTDRSFFQVIEGSPESIAGLYDRIQRDPRHTRPTQIIREPIVHRTFGEWTMGFSDLPSSRIADIPGLNDFFQAGACLSTVNAGRARKLLAAFASGRWRAHLTGPVRVAV